MLDDLLGRGFASKVKSLIKVTKTRIEAIRKKRNATNKFLNQDIAHLLANGLDINAFGRAEGLVTELILSSCYDFVEHCCECVLKNISALHKKKYESCRLTKIMQEFSEDCKVAVASLMFAAARFSDLPELRDLRQIFQGRYGLSFDHYINQKFVKNLSAKPASTESKLQLMQDIAHKYSISWNAKTFEQRMSMPHVSTQKDNLEHRSFYDADNRINTAKCYKAEAVNCTSLRGLFDKPDQDSKENAISRNEGRNEMSFDDILSSNVNEAFRKYEDVNERRVESVHLFSGGKNVTGMVDRNNSEFSFLGDTEVFDVDDSHTNSNFRGIKVRHMVDSHIARDPFSSSSKNIEGLNRQKCVSSDHQQSGSFSTEINLNKLHEIIENTTPHRLLHIKQETCSSGEQKLSSETERHFIGSQVSSAQKQKNLLMKEPVQEGNEAKIKHFHPPPYVKPSKVAQDTVDFEPKNAKSHEDFLSPKVSDADHNSRLKSGSSQDGIQGKFDDPNYVKSINGHAKPPKASRHVRISESVHTGTQSKERGRTMHHHRNGASVDHEDIARLILPKPRSTRRRSTRSSSNESSHIEGSDKCDEKKTASRTSNRRKQRESRSIKQRTSTDMDIPIKDEDKILDNLLIHYSSKPSNPDTADNSLKKTGEVQVRASFPPRSVSLPCEQSVPLKPTKVFNRAATFQLDRTAQHVHPKLPDYDDLAARFSAMKAKF